MRALIGLGDFAKAEEIFSKALHLMNNYNTNKVQKLRMTIDYYDCLGELNYLYGKYDKALQCYESNYLNLREIYGYSAKEYAFIHTLLNMAEANIELNNNSKAEENLKASQEILLAVTNDKTKDFNKARLLLIQSKLFFKKTAFETAYNTVVQSENMFEDIQSIGHRHYGEALFLLSNYLYTMKNFDKSKEFLKDAIQKFPPNSRLFKSAEEKLMRFNKPNYLIKSALAAILIILVAYIYQQEFINIQTKHLRLG
jgi:tetratricopeptide (TPR) repeat protein